MSNKADQSTKGGEIGTKTLSPSQGEYVRQNVSTNQEKQSSAKNSRSGGKPNA